ncbi:hypothetical protein [Corynebacterium nuruki]|uniref:hypothetical protein n=1 Tax=Corynebacterium nuruki TaxID=1032851 RepID=UPI0002486A74|nr:hypothetical protein [Corynebacterium nuruki]
MTETPVRLVSEQRLGNYLTEAFDDPDLARALHDWDRQLAAVIAADPRLSG